MLPIEPLHDVQGNCTGPPPGQPGLLLDPPADIAAQQCVLIVTEGFLNISTLNSISPVWLSNIYITLPGLGVKKSHTTLIGVRGGDVYLTATTFVADAYNSRAVDDHDDGRLYIERALQNVAVMTLQAVEGLGKSLLPLSASSLWTKSGMNP